MIALIKHSLSNYFLFNGILCLFCALLALFSKGFLEYIEFVLYLFSNAMYYFSIKLIQDLTISHEHKVTIYYDIKQGINEFQSDIIPLFLYIIPVFFIISGSIQIYLTRNTLIQYYDKLKNIMYVPIEI